MGAMPIRFDLATIRRSTDTTIQHEPAFLLLHGAFHYAVGLCSLSGKAISADMHCRSPILGSGRFPVLPRFLPISPGPTVICDLSRVCSGRITGVKSFVCNGLRSDLGVTLAEGRLTI